MNKKDIEDYLSKLQDIEKSLQSEDGDFSVIGDLNKVLSALDNDIQMNTMAKHNTLDIKIKKLNPNAVIPSYSKSGDAGMDLTAVSIDYDGDTNVVYGTGLSMEIPNGYVGLVFPRSSNSKKDLYLTNHVGVIDSGYRGEIMLKFRKTKEVIPRYYEVGDRVGQIIILPYPTIKFVESEELSSTERGEGGFGSTGT
jgi:dUTP pyrophosphatase